MRRIILFPIISLLLSACGIPPYDEPGHEKAGKHAHKFTEFNHVIAGQNSHGVKTGDTNNPAVLFIHGAPSDWRAWGMHLADTDLLESTHMIAVDRPGYGGSDAGKWEGSLKQQAQAVMEAALKEHTGSFLVVGHSFGGPVALQIAIDYPEHTNNLIVLAGAIDPELEETKWFQYAADFFLFRWLVPTNFDVANQEIFALKDELKKQQKLLSKIKTPVLVIQGNDDELVPKGNADYAEKHLINAELEIIRIPEQGHFLPWEQYDLLKSQILKRVENPEQLFPLR